MAIFGNHRSKELPQFIVDVYSQNYMSEDPVRQLYSRLHEPNGYDLFRYDGDLQLKVFPPGIRYRKFRRLAPPVLFRERFVYDQDVVLRVLTYDQLAEIQRVTISVFLNDRLVSSMCHFPHLAQEDKSQLIKLARAKYFEGKGPQNLDRICVAGKNDVHLYLRDFVSVSFHYLHRTPELVSDIHRIVRWMNSQSQEETERRTKELMKKI